MKWRQIALCLFLTASLFPGCKKKQPPAPAATPPPKEEAKRITKMLDKIETEPLWMSYIGSLHNCLHQQGRKIDPVWLYGGSGHAFAMNMHITLCPSGPTAWRTQTLDTMMRNLGTVIKRIEAPKNDANFAAKQAQAVALIKREIDAKQSLRGWELGAPEWQCINGYDSDNNIKFIEVWGEQKETPAEKLGDGETGRLCVTSVGLGPMASRRQQIRDVLAFAAEDAAGYHALTGGLYQGGLAGYDTWIAALENPNIAKEENAGLGAAYNAQCWAEARAMAVKFLAAAQKRLSAKTLKPLFAQAVADYQTVADNLKIVAGLFPMDRRHPQTMTMRLDDVDRRAKAVEALRKAKAAEIKGLATLAKIQAELDKPAKK